MRSDLTDKKLGKLKRKRVKKRVKARKNTYIRIVSSHNVSYDDGSIDLQVSAVNEKAKGNQYIQYVTSISHKSIEKLLRT